jgi:hypothetical protein
VDIGGKCISYKPYRWVQFSNTKNLFYSQKRNLTISYRTLSLKNRVMWMSLFKIFSTYQILKQMVKNEEDFKWRKTLKNCIYSASSSPISEYFCAAFDILFENSINTLVRCIVVTSVYVCG